MHVLDTYNFKIDRINSNREKVAKSIFLDALGQLNFVVRVQILPNFELVQAFMHVLITCKYEKDQM